MSNFTTFCWSLNDVIIFFERNRIWFQWWILNDAKECEGKFVTVYGFPFSSWPFKRLVKNWFVISTTWRSAWKTCHIRVVTRLKLVCAAKVSRPHVHRTLRDHTSIVVRWATFVVRLLPIMLAFSLYIQPVPPVSVVFHITSAVRWKAKRNISVLQPLYFSFWIVIAAPATGIKALKLYWRWWMRVSFVFSPTIVIGTLHRSAIDITFFECFLKRSEVSLLPTRERFKKLYFWARLSTSSRHILALNFQHPLAGQFTFFLQLFFD